MALRPLASQASTSAPAAISNLICSAQKLLKDRTPFAASCCSDGAMLSPLLAPQRSSRYFALHSFNAACRFSPADAATWHIKHTVNISIIELISCFSPADAATWHIKHTVNISIIELISCNLLQKNSLHDVTTALKTRGHGFFLRART